MSDEINEHLKCVLYSHNIENDEEQINAYREKKSDLKDALSNKFEDNIYYIFDSGSYKKSTAINSKFDLDICIPFQQNGETLESIYDEVHDFFRDEYRDSELLNGPSKQKVSIGLEFITNGKRLDFDIVPGREVSDYESEKSLNLYINGTYGAIDESYIKTNIDSQVEYISSHGEARDIIKLLKVWRNNSGISSMKSFFIELITIRAFKDNAGNIPTSLWDRLRMVLEYIHNRVENIQLLDPGNTNNNVAETLDDFQKTLLAQRCEQVINNVVEDSENINNHFPVNNRYPCDEDNKGSAYIVTGASSPDRIPDNDFG